MVDVKELGYSGWTLDEIKNQRRIADNELSDLKRQLTQTQQALDRAVEALEKIVEYYDLQNDVSSELMIKARTALASIKE